MNSESEFQYKTRTERSTTMTQEKQKFTLIELLVVIAMITILPVQNF